MLEIIRGELDRAKACRQRSTLVLAGEREHCLALAVRLLGGLSLPEVYWFGDRVPDSARAVSAGAARRLLGREIDALVFDAWAGFDPDAFGALTGCIRGGGLLVLLTPALAEWPAYPDPQNARITVAPWSADRLSGRFLWRLARVIGTDPGILLYEQGSVLRLPAGTAQAPPESGTPAEGSCRTRDQQRAVEALVKVATGHRRRPLVLISDRGRGKSSAFGIAAARLVGCGRGRILVTAPRSDAVDVVLDHAERERPGARAHIRFVAPDELVRDPPDADLLLVDEAAAIPMPLLERLLRRYARIAFATTVHGYEGTGRGFELRFSQLLDRLSNSWTRLELTQPIRWGPHDPLERLVFRMLALDAEPADGSVFAGIEGAGSYELLRLERDALVADESLLSELFGLLVQAHYRTRPLDLRHLLDGPNLSVYVMRAGNHIAATALVAAEGGFDETTAGAIRAGRVRPHGHLLPETLAAHQGLGQAPLLRCGRIMRVAVHPALQRRGLGSRLIGAIAAELDNQGCDYVGASFGISAGLLRFWRALGWLPVRLSIQKSAASGAHSAVFLRAASAPGETLARAARERFFAQFPHQLSDSLRELDPELVAGLLRQAEGERDLPLLNDADREELHAFAFEQRLTEVAIGSLWRMALRELMLGRVPERLDATETAILVMRVLQKRSWPDCAGSLGLSGRRQALACLRQAVRKLAD
jgi:tRNA(Met) cytidine acetyltransferase